MPYSPSHDSETEWPDLADALDMLRQSMCRTRDAHPRRASGSSDAFRGTLHIALLPPLAHVRRVELPGLSLNEARQVLRREPSRYLPLAVSAARLELEVVGQGWPAASPFTLFAAPRALVESIHAAARQSGWRVAEIVSAEAAWAASATSLKPAAKNGDRTVVVSTPECVEILTVRDADLVAIRRLPASAPDIAALTASPGG
jgi:hypothetical protein